MGLNLHVSLMKIIQCKQRSLILPILVIPWYHLCLIAALRHHLSLDAGLVSAHVVTVSSRLGFEPITLCFPCCTGSVSAKFKPFALLSSYFSQGQGQLLPE